jgi:TPR repeat protein
MKKIFMSILSMVILTAESVSAENHLNDLNVDQSFRTAVKLVEDQQYIDAINIFTILAERDIPEAQYNLSLLLFNGLGAPKNFKSSLKWAWKAYLNEHEYALIQVNDILDMIPADVRDSVANELIQEISEIAKDKNQLATLKVGITFTELLSEPDYLSAYVWLSIAQAYGIEKASDLLAEVTDQLSIEEVLAQQELATQLFEEMN